MKFKKENHIKLFNNIDSNENTNKFNILDKNKIKHTELNNTFTSFNKELNNDFWEDNFKNAKLSNYCEIEKKQLVANNSKDNNKFNNNNNNNLNKKVKCNKNNKYNKLDEYKNFNNNIITYKYNNNNNYSKLNTKSNNHGTKLYERAKLKNELGKLLFFKNLEIKESEELKECTFKPFLNRLSSLPKEVKEKLSINEAYEFNLNEPIYERQSRWKYRSMLKLSSLKNNNDDNKEYSFKPILCNYSIDNVLKDKGFSQDESNQRYILRQDIARLEKQRKNNFYDKSLLGNIIEDSKFNYFKYVISYIFKLIINIINEFR